MVVKGPSSSEGPVDVNFAGHSYRFWTPPPVSSLCDPEGGVQPRLDAPVTRKRDLPGWGAET